MFSTTSQPQFFTEAVKLLVAFNVPEASARSIMVTAEIYDTVHYGKHMAIRRLRRDQPKDPLADPTPEFLVCFTEDVNKLPSEWQI